MNIYWKNTRTLINVHIQKHTNTHLQSFIYTPQYNCLIGRSQRATATQNSSTSHAFLSSAITISWCSSWGNSSNAHSYRLMTTNNQTILNSNLRPNNYHIIYRHFMFSLKATLECIIERPTDRLRNRHHITSMRRGATRHMPFRRRCNHDDEKRVLKLILCVSTYYYLSLQRTKNYQQRREPAACTHILQ